MTIFAIHDASQERILGYLFYYNRAGRFYVELLGGLTEWEAPAMFYGHVKKHIYSIDSEWSMKWVRQRIIPGERQNIGSILKENNLKEYDEYKLLVLSEGRCAQDDEYIVKTDTEKLPDEIKGRLARKVRDVLVIDYDRAYVFFRDDTARIINLIRLLDGNRIFANVLANEELLHRVKLSPGGNGIEWDETRSITAERLYSSGKKTDVSYSDFLTFIKNRTVDTSQLTNMLGISRQYINQLVKEERITPVAGYKNTNIFSKADVETYFSP